MPARAPGTGLHRHLRVAGLAVGAAVLLAGLVAALIVLDDLGRVTSEERHAEEVQLAVARVRAGLIDAETGARGFAASSEPEFLEPYRTAVREWPANIEELRRLTRANPGEQARLHRIEVLARAVFDRVEASLVEPPGGRAHDVVAQLRQGEREMDELRELFAAMVDEERRLDASRVATAAARKRSLLLLLAGGIVLLAILGALAVAGARERRATERLRRERDDAFAEIDALLGHAPVGLVLFDRALHFRRLNAAQAEMSGVPMEQHLGKAMREVLPGLPAELDAQLREVTDTGAAVIDQRMTVEVPAFPGELRTWQASYVPVCRADGEVIGVGGVIADVTDQARAERELERARADAVGASLAKDEFLAMLGHELRNPLAPIRTALELMQLRAPDSGARERAIIERQTQHLAVLVDDLLDVARITRGKVALRRQRRRLAELVARAIETAAPLLERSRHQLTVDVPRELIVDGDEARLIQVFGNLVSNAAKYTPAGGRIVVTGAREGDELVIRVEDTGRGLAPEMLPRVFELFVQERQALDRAQGGLGLGLAIVRSLVELHGGRVTAHSDGPGRGAAFVVRLPAGEAGDLEAGASIAADAAVAAAAATPRPGRVVLVVDDNEDAAELLADALRELHCDVHVAHDAPQALALAAHVVPDLALLDIGLPAMDGYELAQRLRELSPGWREVRLIAVTGYGQDKDRARSREAGFDVHLVKPIRLADLDGLVAS